MTKEEVKEYLKENLYLYMYKDYTMSNEIKLTISLYLENEKLTEEYVNITEGKE
jgi:hypothetical protein